VWGRWKRLSFNGSNARASVNDSPSLDRRQG
jgi:hypothetical protein